MNIWADYHTHTRYSHGSGSIEQNVKSAIKKGLSTIGISEHGPANIGIGPKLGDFYKMRKEIEKLKNIYTNIDILLGCEANIVSLDGKLDIPDEILANLDYIMVGLHPMVWAQSLGDGFHLFVENTLAKMFRNATLKERVMKQNTNALVRAIKSKNIKIITHPGLHLPIDTEQLAIIAAKNETALEINAGHGYMTEEYVRIAHANGARFAIGSDAHHPKDVGRFDKAVDIARKAGLTAEDIINASTVKETVLL
ncbi:MAG: PHP domain-containing protein [Tepidanaerobacteraceae bacterium]|nr:PHP domain-containing protein [Tepidanaerobacteraceae bacterium]